MKKTAVCIIFVVMLFGVCFAQSGSMKDRIVGTWSDRNGGRWVFNANGKLKINNEEYTYGVSEKMSSGGRGNSKLAMTDGISMLVRIRDNEIDAMFSVVMPNDDGQTIVGYGMFGGKTDSLRLTKL